MKIVQWRAFEWSEVKSQADSKKLFSLLKRLRDWTAPELDRVVRIKTNACRGGYTRTSMCANCRGRPSARKSVLKIQTLIYEHHEDTCDTAILPT
ncbi:hypothetical protein [Duncaniella dubosii]|uniref:hypothetical protein n=1 Tax=Duncaniella dubosii TaxID=2518971 RepID=UPI003F66E7EF